ncbi:MAG: glucose-1-phosphate thymidylyltransferase [Actinobacteria bacterium]|nr:glucose-1-phosphate thymidylyltransferase [Actinomycetota bacterium]
MLKAEDFFDLEDNPLRELFKNTEFVWEGLKNIKGYIKDNITPNVLNLRKGSSLISRDMVIHNGEILESGFTINNSNGTVTKDGVLLKGASIIYAGVFLMDDEIYIGEGTVIESGALIKGPTIIGDGNEIRQGAYIRGNVIVGNKCVVGHTTEMKTAVMLGESKAGHFAYIGDSILGKVNLGAGTKLANLKIIESKISLTIDGNKYETGLRKFGAIFADGVETGCNSVTMPGSLLSRDVILYPNTTARGYYPPDTIIKLKHKAKMGKRR